MEIRRVFYALLLSVLMTGTGYAQHRTVNYNLAQWLSEKKLDIVNREATAGPTGGALLSAADGDGVAWLDKVDFSNGIIEVDLKGKNVEQQSFLGIAFHGVDGKTLDAIYFRPFNFRSTDLQKHIHMVEYVSHPKYTWQVLREKFPGQYEKGLSNPPNPDGWFHVRIEVNYPEIKVFVGDDQKPCLTVKQLNDRKSGKIGLWVGNGSDGAFANLKISFRK
ncbi:hypothetical protein HDF18_11385 [Mucilaginibacter sp. X5P1]|uniref:hypothetical protein n=1 Tax=Mucilaginibacter sp. X5P1 TaxID=2723088 RepID=UPI00161F4D22|nr:hypothetical protein [Mucilaginibacter sp. X5P1]MBB6140585.1 hypothetical protein [Mucilaginibacter sp. X5P1]